jgi:hypothetical protein
LRLQIAAFFLTGTSVGLVDESENIVLDCYWLARWFHQSPEHFLEMPISRVALHMSRTQQMIARMRPPKDDG